MPYAIRSLRQASGAEVDGEHFEHQKWTIVDQPTDVQRSASEGTFGVRPILEIFEVSDSGDPLLAPFEVKNADEYPAPKAKKAKASDEPPVDNIVNPLPPTSPTGGPATPPTGPTVVQTIAK